MVQGLVRPPRLRPGDRLAAVSLSFGGPAAFPDRYEDGRRQLERALGVEVVEFPHTRADPADLAANPQARVDDLHAALVDPSIAGIVSSVGGDDSLRLLPLLDLDLVRSHPKVLLGYSDTTSIHMAFLRAGVVSFYGPAVMAGFAEAGGPHRYTIDGVRRTLFEDVHGTTWPVNTDGWTVEHLDWADPANRGRVRALQPSSGARWLTRVPAVEGPLVPVCLEVADWLRGTPWWPDLDGAVLALETSEEGVPPATVVRFLRALALRGDLDRIAALLLARPGGVPAEEHLAYDDAVRQVLHVEHARTSLPVVTNLDFGHTDPIWTLPVGVRVRVDPRTERITFVEDATAV